MGKEDLVAALKNAVERGESLEKAKQSFISAGYPREEVEEASRSVHSGSVLAAGEGLQMPKLAAVVKPSRSKRSEKPEESKEQGGLGKEPVSSKIKRNLKIILLISLLILLIIIFIITLIFREDIVNWFV